MKGIKAIALRNILSVGVIAVVLLLTNVILLVSFIAVSGNRRNMYSSIKGTGSGFYYEDSKLKLSEKAENDIDTYFAWAMMLDDGGKVIWSRNLPEEFPQKYSVSDVAAFSKWYLNDYPVNVWQTNNGLLVFGSEKGSLWKHEISFPENMMENIFLYIGVFLIINFSVAIILALFSGLRFFKGLKTVAAGVKDISEKKPVSLHIKGPFKELAEDINRASLEIIRQQEVIDKRDNARNNWIRGVSHDIRTPLSMIMGYASTLESNMDINEKSRKEAAIIRSQSEKIKDLVNDLNLTVKLEYEMQPLNLEAVDICEILRKVCVDYLNNMYDERYSINLEVNSDIKSYVINGDRRLLERVFSNIIGNSISHNENGCSILIKVDKVTNRINNNISEKNNERIADRINIDIADNGIGFEEKKLKELNSSSELPTGKNHGLGLFIVKQIVQVHKGKILYGNGAEGAEIKIQL